MGRLSSAPAVDHRSLAIALYNDCWRLLEKVRSAAEDDELLHQAHASAYHWLKAPEREAKNRARSEWLCSRAYAVLGRAEPALHHAKRCLAICEESVGELEEWDLAFAYEALARAHRVADEAGEAARYERLAREAAQQIGDAEDRDLVLSDLATL